MPWTLANIITLCRLLFLVPALYLLVSGERSLALIFMGVVLAGDLIDGYLARARNEETEFGRILDPVIDKLVFSALFIVLTILGEIALGWLIGLIIIQLGVMIGSILWLKAYRTAPKPRTLGKLASFILALGLLSMIIELPYALYSVYAGVILTGFAAADYFINAIRTSRAHPPESQGSSKQRIPKEELT